MAEAGKSKTETFSAHSTASGPAGYVHPAWLRLMRFCSELGHGEIEKLKIQDGVPVIADIVREKVKFT